MLIATQLAGFGAGGALSSLSFVDSATSTGASVTGPAGILPGDLLVLFDRAVAAGSGTPPTTVLPSGFTSISNSPGSNAAPNSVRSILSYKIADGSEASASLTGMNGSSNGKMLAVFRGDAPVSSVSPSTPNAETTDGNPASQNVAASGGVAPLIVVGAYGCGTAAVDPRTFSPAKDAEITSSGTGTRYLAYKIYNSSPADVTVDMDDEGDLNSLQSCFITCS
jgi:hypothetical protein